MTVRSIPRLAIATLLILTASACAKRGVQDSDVMGTPIPTPGMPTPPASSLLGPSSDAGAAGSGSAAPPTQDIIPEQAVGAAGSAGDGGDLPSELGDEPQEDEPQEDEPQEDEPQEDEPTEEPETED